VRRLLVLTLLLAALTACGIDDGESPTTLTVYAAASLTATFEEIADDFEAEHDGVEVELSFGGSSDLVTQITEGAPADVFASAATANMDDLVGADLTGAEPQDFATNVLQIAVPPGNPAGVTSLEDLAGDLNLVLCAPEVPCGAASQSVAEAAGVTLSPVSEEQSVTDVLAKVASGEADAGLVYATDAVAAGDDVEAVEIPGAEADLTSYYATTLEQSENADLAADWLAWVTSEEGRAILHDAGFGSP